MLRAALPLSLRAKLKSPGLLPLLNPRRTLLEPNTLNYTTSAGTPLILAHASTVDSYELPRMMS